MSTGDNKPQRETKRGVSPVISVVLMVAIALILAAVIGAFVLEFGGETDEGAPSISADLDRQTVTTAMPGAAGNEQIIIKHGGGGTVPVSELRIITEARCFDRTTLADSGTRRGQLYNLPVQGSGGPNSIDNDENVEGAEIFDTNPAAIEAPLSGSDETWNAGERLKFQIDEDACDVPGSGEVSVELIHEPSNSRIVSDSFGTGFRPSVLQNEFDPATPGSTSTHTWVLDGITYGTSGDEVGEITVDYGTSGASMDGLSNADITVTMTRTLSGNLDRSEISVNGGSYSGSSDTFDLSGLFKTDVAGPITIEIDGIENPGSTGSFPVDITLDGDAGMKTFTETLEIEN